MRAAVERWADEFVAAVGDRSLAALAAALAGTDGVFAERAQALLAAPPRRRPVLSAGVGALMFATTSAVLVAAVQANARFEAAEHAYHTSAPLRWALPRRRGGVPEPLSLWR